MYDIQSNDEVVFVSHTVQGVVVSTNRLDLTMRCQEADDIIMFFLDFDWQFQTGEAKVEGARRLPNNVQETAFFTMSWTSSETKYSYEGKTVFPGGSSEVKEEFPGPHEPGSRLLRFDKTIGPIKFAYDFPQDGDSSLLCEVTGTEGGLKVEAIRRDGGARVDYFYDLYGNSASYSLRLQDG